MFKAIATDVDGTITNSNEKIDPEAIIKIRELEKLNIPVVLISGHNLCSLETLSEYIGTSGPIVAENGCVVSKEPWAEPVIMGSRKITFKALKFLKQKFGDYKVKLKPLNRYRNVDLSLYRTFNTYEANELLKKENIGAFIMDSGFAIHIIDSKINKGVGVKKAAELMGINTKEIIGIGDGGNDYHFLKEVGYSIALGHSDMKIKNIANFITKNSYGSGFVEAINHVVKNLLNL